MTPNDVYMVRKQLYISDEHERALKARALRTALESSREPSAWPAAPFYAKMDAKVWPTEARM